MLQVHKLNMAKPHQKKVYAGEKRKKYISVHPNLRENTVDSLAYFEDLVFVAVFIRGYSYFVLCMQLVLIKALFFDTIERWQRAHPCCRKSIFIFHIHVYLPRFGIVSKSLYANFCTAFAGISHSSAPDRVRFCQHI